jgi:D-alanyl-D-alanine carboxypeptidase/D-alanyl-D-alanine-endopeptidase (penicillin-binding protein 4)
MLDRRGDDVPMPPASTAKVITTLFTLDYLPRDHRFSTRLVATGPVRNGRVAGDLVLAGGGDPTVSTDQLGDMASRLRAAGVQGVDGRFLVWGGALPYLREIDPAQKVHFGYNPSVSGINVNFNRVNMVWTRGAAGPVLSMDARGERFVPPVHVARARVADRETPVFTYSDLDGVEDWTVARPALVRDGSRWLPVRHPERYAGDVFRTLAKAQGIDLPSVSVAEGPPVGQALVTLQSDPLAVVIRDMLKYSTNLTAEALGMAAGLAAGAAGHGGTVARMCDWFAAATGGARADLVDHSGLGGASRMTPSAMLAALVQLGPKAGLRGLMKDIPLGEKGKPKPGYSVQAKTGTLNFVSALAGYMTTAKGRDLAFVIFTGDPARRDAAMADESERPVGTVSWTKRSKRLQGQLLERWAGMADA